MLNLQNLIRIGYYIVRSLFLTKNELSNKFNKNIIWINPDKIKLFSSPPNWWWYGRLDKRINNKKLKKILYKFAMKKFFYGGNWDLSANQFQDTDWIKNIRSLKLNYKNYENSNWYKFIKLHILEHGTYKYKKKIIKNDKQLNSFFEIYLKRIIKSLKINGFKINVKSKDIPKVLIGRNGKLIKTGNGCHRLAMIQEFSIKCSYPVQIVGVHKEFCIKGVKAKFLKFRDINKFVLDKYGIKLN